MVQQKPQRKPGWSARALILFSLLLVFFAIAHRASAEVIRTKLNVENTGDFVVEPGKTEIFLNPGETVTKYVTITNRLNKRVDFSLTPEDFVGSEDNLNPVILLGDEIGPYSLKNFIQPELSTFSLEFGEKITIPVTVSAPLDAEPRGYYGAMVVSNAPSILSGDKTDSGAQGRTRLVSRVGSLFLVRVNGEGRESGVLKDFKTIGPQKKIYEKKPTGFEILFKNDGNVHLVPYGKVTISNLFGKTVSEIPVDAYFALPDSLRYREVVWKEGFALGRYSAHLSLYRGYGNQYDEKDIVFWILPWKILLAVFAVIFFSLLILYYIVSRFEFRRK